jgi:hypothetical protein
VDLESSAVIGQCVFPQLICDSRRRCLASSVVVIVVPVDIVFSAGRIAELERVVARVGVRVPALGIRDMPADVPGVRAGEPAGFRLVVPRREVMESRLTVALLARKTPGVRPSAGATSSPNAR